MASAQVVETSVTNNSPSQDSYHQDDLFQSRYATPGFKPFSPMGLNYRMQGTFNHGPNELARLARQWEVLRSLLHCRARRAKRAAKYMNPTLNAIQIIPRS